MEEKREENVHVSIFCWKLTAILVEIRILRIEILKKYSSQRFLVLFNNYGDDAGAKNIAETFAISKLF